MKQNKIPDDWQETELKEIFVFEPKTGKKAGEGSKKGKYKFFTSSSEQSKFIDNYDFEGEHLIFSSGGQEAIHYCNEKFSASNDCFVVRVNKVLAKYVFYYLSSKMWLLAKGFRGAGLQHVSSNYIKLIKIIYPEKKETQKKIVAILEKADKLKQKREESDILMRDYLKNSFYEIFGDPLSNNKLWSLKTIREVSDRISDGPFGSNLKTEHYTENGVRVIRLQNVGVGEFLDDDKMFISFDHYSKLKKYTCKPGDIIVGTLGDPNLRACILPDYVKYAVNKADCIQIKPNKDLLNAEYLCHLLNTEQMQRVASAYIHGETRTRISMGQVAALRIPVPPLSLQEKFVKISQRFDQMCANQKQSSMNMDALFQSMMQKAFNGELIC